MKFIVDTETFMTHGKYKLTDAKVYGNISKEQRDYSFGLIPNKEAEDGQK